MDPETTVLSSGVFSLERYAMLTNRTFKDTLLRAGRGAVKYGMRITPPFQADGGPDAPTGPAKQRGERAIFTDLARHFRPVRSRGTGPRGIQYPARIHLRLLKEGRKRPGRPLQRDQAAPYFVDASKLNALEKELRSHVGKLASGWVPAANALQATGTPQWISRHGTSRGSVTVELDAAAMFVEAVNFATSASAGIASEVQRRIPYALRYQYNAMQRELDVLLLRDATKAGLTVA